MVCIQDEDLLHQCQISAGGMIRHIAIRDEKALRLLLVENSPADVYCSNSYYLFPNMEMRKKDWQGADLIFDIDAKDLHLECRPSHTCVICGECGNVSNNTSECMQCSSTKHTTSSLPCKKWIDAAKKEVLKLINIAINILSKFSYMNSQSVIYAKN